MISTPANVLKTRGYRCPPDCHRSPKTPQKAQRELEDLQLVLKARNGEQRGPRRADPPLHGVRPAEGELVLPRRRRQRRPDPGGADRPLQGGPRLPPRQGDVVPLVRRALRHPADHHGDQDRHPLQALAAEHATSRSATRPPGQDPDGDCTLGDALPGPHVNDPAVCVISTEELQSLVGCLGTASRRSSPTRCASTSRAPPTRRWPRSSAATRRRSTTRSSGSSARS